MEQKIKLPSMGQVSLVLGTFLVLAFLDDILNRGGMVNMLGSVAVIIFGLGFGGLLDKVGILETIARTFENRITNEGNLTAYTVATASWPTYSVLPCTYP